MGDTINVIVKSASKEAGTIDFINCPSKRREQNKNYLSSNNIEKIGVYLVEFLLNKK